MNSLPVIDLNYRLENREQACLSSVVASKTGPTGQLSTKDLPSDTQKYGECLFAYLFPRGSDLEAAYLACKAASHGRQVIRFRLEFSNQVPDSIRDLHWELIYDPRDEEWLANRRSMWLSRFCGVGKPIGTPTTELPGLLIAVADPQNVTDYGATALDYDTFVKRTEEALQPLRNQLAVHILAPPVSPKRLKSYLESTPIHMIHLVAHGAPGKIMLEDHHHRANLMPADRFAKIFGDQWDTRLITLMSCHGATDPSADIFGAIGRKLVEKNIPAVVAMRNFVSFQAIHDFTGSFYHHLASQPIVDRATNLTRSELFLTHPRGDAWAQAALFMRLESGRLWEIPQRIKKKQDAVSKVPRGVTISVDRSKVRNQTISVAENAKDHKVEIGETEIHDQNFDLK